MSTPTESPAPTSDSTKTPEAKNRAKLWIIVLAIVFVILYVVGALAFKSADGSYTVNGDEPTVTDGLRIDAIPISIAPATNQVTVRLLPEAVGTVADPQGNPNEPITLTVNAYSGNSVIEIEKDKPISAQEVKLYAGGRWSSYPLDKYEGTLQAIATTNGGQTDVPIALVGNAGLEGWALSVSNPQQSAEAPSEATFILSRPFVTQTFVFIVLILFILIALFAITVAYVVGARKRRIEPALLGWGAALLFALPALRNAMPGAPPIGAWIDILVFLWVIVIAVISYLVVVSTWVRKSAPPE